MHSITLGLLLPALLLLSPATAKLPSNKILHTHPTGTAPYYPTGTAPLYPTGTGYHHPHGTGPLSYGGSGSGPSEAGSTCALPTTVTTTTQITVTVTVPPGGGSPTTIPTAIPTAIGTGGIIGTGTGIIGPTASAGLVRRRDLEMRGLGEEKMGRGRKE